MFSDDQIERRLSDHWSIAERFCVAFENKFRVSLSIDEHLLYLVIISAYDDIDRYKQYHLEDPDKQRSDAVKRSAFLTKWINRFRPIRISDYNHTDPNAKDKTATVNEMFAVSVSTHHLSYDVGHRFIMNPEKQYDLIYDLLYREMTDDALIIFYQTIVEVASNVKITKKL